MEIIKPYLKYLNSGYNLNELIAVNAMLESMGFRKRNQAIKNFLLNPHKKKYQNLWTDGNCFVSFIPPDIAKNGDVWLDLADFSLFIYLSNPPDWSEDVKGWYSMHPVMVWQFSAFLDLVEWKMASTEHSVIDVDIFNIEIDFFDTKKILGQKPHSYVSGYPGNACAAYCAWFNRAILGELIEVAIEALPAQLIDTMLPDKFRFWIPGDEPDWLGVDKHSLVSNIDFYDVDEFQYTPFSGDENILFNQWTNRSKVISFQKEVLVYPYIVLTNPIPRPMKSKKTE